MASAPVTSPPHVTVRPYLYIDAQHGLGNRLRAIASAAAIAQATGRKLVVIWVPDHHCAAQFEDVVSFDGPVLNTPEAAALMRERAATVYNYMEIEAGARFQEPILADPTPLPGDVYVRSAYTLTSPHADRRFEDRFLRNLQPVDAVRALVAGVAHPSQVAVHIRMATGPAFDHLAHESPANWPEERHRELLAWRRRSHVDRFIARLDRLAAEQGRLTIFAAADLAETYALLGERYGEALRFLPRTLFDRSALQVQTAMADMILLTAAPLFLASGWSSFSDVAQRIAPPGRRCEQSGQDF